MQALPDLTRPDVASHRVDRYSMRVSMAKRVVFSEVFAGQARPGIVVWDAVLVAGHLVRIPVHVLKASNRLVAARRAGPCAVAIVDGVDVEPNRASFEGIHDVLRGFEAILLADGDVQVPVVPKDRPAAAMRLVVEADVEEGFLAARIASPNASHRVPEGLEARQPQPGVEESLGWILGIAGVTVVEVDDVALTLKHRRAVRGVVSIKGGLVGRTRCPELGMKRQP